MGRVRPAAGRRAPLATGGRGAAGRGAETGVALDRLLAELRDGGGSDAPATPQAPARLFELLLGALGGLAETTPTVVVVEDIHWADHATQDLLRFLARNLREEQLLILASLRSDEPAPPGLRHLLAELARSARVERLELTRLTAEDTALQVAGIVGADGDAALAEWVHGRAEGNPYFAEELLAARVAGGPGAALPDSLRDVLLARMAGLDEAPRQVVLVAAAAGRDIGHELLARRRTGRRRHRRRPRGWSPPRARVRPAAERYRVRHALADEAVYTRAAAARAASAARCDRPGARGGGPSTDRGAGERAALAQHWDGAHDEEAVLRSWVTAARRPTGSRRSSRRAAISSGPVRCGSGSRRTRGRRGLDEVELQRRLADETPRGRLRGRDPIAEAALELVDAGAEPGRAASIHIQLGVLRRSRERALPAARARARAAAVRPVARAGARR